jgi:hypothetical protein
LLEKLQEKLPFIAFNALLGGTGSIANDLLHGERNPLAVARDGIIGAVTESVAGLGGKFASTITLDALGNGLDNIASQGFDHGWNKIDPLQIPFSMAVGAVVGGTAYLGTIAEFAPFTSAFGAEDGKVLAYNIVYGVADLAASACNIYDSDVAFLQGGANGPHYKGC